MLEKHTCWINLLFLGLLNFFINFFVFKTRMRNEKPPLLPPRVEVVRRHCSQNESPTLIRTGRQGGRTLAKNLSYRAVKRYFGHCTLLWHLPPTQPKLLIHIHFYGHHLQMWTTKKRQVQAKALGNEKGFHCKRKEISFMLKSFFTAQLGACLCSGFNYLPYSEYAWNLNLCVPRCMAHKTKLYWIRNVLHTWIHNSGFLDLAVVELQCISRIWSSHSKVWLTNGHNMLPWTSLSDV